MTKRKICSIETKMENTESAWLATRPFFDLGEFTEKLNGDYSRLG